MVHLCAGGIITASIDNELKYLVIKQWSFINLKFDYTFPKGHIEKEESSLLAAKREIYEEVSLCDITLIDFLGQQEYSYSLGTKIHNKTVDWYLFHANKPQELSANVTEGIMNAKWVASYDLPEIITHHSLLPFFKKATQLA